MSTVPFPEFPSQLDGSEDLLQKSTTQDNNSSSIFLPATIPSSMLNHSASISPNLNNIDTPAESVSSIHYQSSTSSELEPGDDSYFDADLSILGGNAQPFPGDLDFTLFASDASLPDVLFADRPYPISPDQTPSLQTSSPQTFAPVTQDFQLGSTTAQASADLLAFQQLASQHFAPGATDLTGATGLPRATGFRVNDVVAQLTPDTASCGGSLGNNSRGSLSIEESPSATTAAPMAGQNPHVTVSDFGQDRSAGVSALSAAADRNVPSQPRLLPQVARNEQGAWVPNQTTGLHGVDPSDRTATVLPTSVNEDANARKTEKQNSVVSEWLNSAGGNESPADNGSLPAFEGVPDREIGLGDDTENVEQLGRTYYTENGGGPLTSNDYELMVQSHVWDDAPTRLPITQKDSSRHQPQTSQAAIEKFERMNHDNASFISRAATWGTRRRSLPSISDIEGITSGNFLKKLSLNRGDTRRPSIFRGIQTLVRKPSTSQHHKRSRSCLEDETASTVEPGTGAVDRFSFEQESRVTTSLAPPSRSPSTSRGKHVPSINTALISMASGAASIGTSHARKGSVSQPHAGSASLSPPPLTSPRSPLLKVSNSLRRPRSKSDLTKATPQNPHPNLVRMLKASGGPPVANLAGGSNASSPVAPFSFAGPSTLTRIKIPSKVAVPDPDDEDDDDEDVAEEGDVKTESEELIDKISPSFEGFRELVLGLNPGLPKDNMFLVDRIAYQQMQRYKALLSNKVKHLGYVQGRNCPNKNMCIGQGGSAVPSNEPSDDDELGSPLDGAISADSFPKYIPMPPTTSVPATFECQLCFQNKHFQKPSDWTKHVHEDVQPFTCTWLDCREPKMFKRKADWVRHENEGHRHLEWWTCDVDECTHTCYRRDNFLQHLVREHKFEEPKYKTKAAIKKAGDADPTWQRVDKCHAEVRKRPQDEACRFCGKTFPTWKKLTVHLAKHMEHISLPILRLVDKKDLDADSIVSPIREPPPRPFIPPAFPLPDTTGQGMMASLSQNTSPLQQFPHAHAHRLSDPGAFPQNHLGSAQALSYMAAGMGSLNTATGFGFPQVAFQQPFYGQPQPFVTSPSALQTLDVATMGVQVPVTSGYDAASFGHGNQLPVATTGYLDPATSSFISEPPGLDPTTIHGLSTDPNPLGLSSLMGSGQLGYEASVDPLSFDHKQQFTPHGSVSPYGHSPLQPQGQFF